MHPIPIHSISTTLFRLSNCPLSFLMALASFIEPILTNHSSSSYFRLSSEGKVIDLIGRVQQYSKAPLA